MWFIGVEVEQETGAPPPKKNPGSAGPCTRAQCKNSFGKQLQFMDFSISPFPEGIRLVTPSKA